ncbi:fibronectin type III domain-containing protein [Nonomuraea sp. NPDC003214]
MAVRFKASASDFYTRALGLGSQPSFTVTCWMKISVDLNVFTTIWSIDNGAADYLTLKTATNGTTVRALTDAASHATRALTVGTWYFTAIAVDATSGILVTRSIDEATFTAATWAGTHQLNAANLRLGVWPGETTGMNGCIAGVKIWTAKLSQAEIEAEYATMTPVRTAGLYANYVLAGPSTADDSGNGRTLTGGTTATHEPGPPLDSDPPTTPANLRATTASPTDLGIAWEAATDNTGVAGYGIYLNGAKQGSDQPGLTYRLQGLTPATSYTVEVDAVDGSGLRSPRATLVHATLGEVSGAPAGGEELQRAFYGLSAGQTYLVEVDAVDLHGNRSARASLQVSTDSQPPTVPPNLRVVAVSGTQISVAWDASSDDITGVAGYGVWLDGVQAEAQHAGLGWTFDNLTSGQTYLIEVDAVDGAGHRSARASLQVQAAIDTEPPTVPGNLRVTAMSPYTLSVEWDPSTDAGGVAGYGIYLDGDKQGADQVELVRAFTGLSPTGTYQVGVDAVDATGNRSGQAQLTQVLPADLPPATPPNLRAAAVSYTSFTAAWDAAADDVQVAGYDVAIDGQLVVTAGNVLEHAVSGLPDDTAYTVRVWAVDHIGQRSAVPAELVITTLNDEDPSVPAFTATAGEDSITVAWDASTDDFGVVGYEVTVGGVLVHSTPGLDYTVDGPVLRRHTVAGLVAGATYPVRVAAVDTIGQRSADNTMLVTTTELPFLPIASPVYRIGSWAANVRDEHGVDWVVQEAKGWSSSAPVSPRSAPRGGVDGEWDSAGRYGSRRIELSGVAIARSRAQMLAAKQRLAGVILPEQELLLRVADAVMTRQAKVRLAEPIEARDQTALVFTWRLVVSAKDPRRYATVPVRAEAVIGALPGQAQMTVTMDGTYKTIPARLRLFGPIKDFVITHEESGTVMRSMPGTVVPANPDYSYTIDLGARQVWAHVPAEIWPVPRPGRSALAHLPAWWTLIPGTNTITVSGDPVAGEAGTPRLALEAYDAWA